MTKEIINTDSLRIANELLLEKYMPVMVVTLSRKTTVTLSDKLKDFALDLSKKTGYEVLLFPDEDKTSVNIISVCNHKQVEIDNLREYVYGKYKKPDEEAIPYTKITDRINKK
tara:strand:+ start:1705 stop:2043 length:339 start_codon:yes stop_codon:yes gene_type:complete